MDEIATLNCTQFTEPYPWPGSPDAANYTIPWLVTKIVKVYRPIHYYILVCVVIFDVFANLSVVIVLSRKEMRSVGVNVMMMMIAGCDFFCSVWACVQLFLRVTDTYMTYFVAYMQIASDYLSAAFHASSLYLGVGMALCRVMSLSLSNKNRAKWQTPKFALIVAFSLCIPVFLLGSLIMFLNRVEETEEDGIYLNISPLSLENSCFFMKFVVMMGGVYFKTIPCVMMLVLSLMLLTRIEEGKKSSVNVASKQSDKSQKIDRSSRFIQFVLVIFLVTEIPQAIFGIVGGLFLIDYLNYYQRMAIMMGLLAFINATTSFLVYSTLSAKFRKLFIEIFFPKTLMDKIHRKTTITVQASSSRTI